jgi:hypothetical protein
MNELPDEARAASAALSAEIDKVQEASNLVTRAGSLLALAQLGLRDMAGTDSDRVLLGFCGVVVLGRSAFYTMKALSGIDYARSEFDTWYEPWKAFESDDLVTYFETIRNDVIHPHNRMVGVVLSHWNADPAQPVTRPGEVTFDAIAPPGTHKGAAITDTSMEGLCALYVDHLQAMFESFAPVAFGVSDKRMAEWHAERDRRASDTRDPA